MSSKRFKKLPEKTNTLPAETIDKVLALLKKIVQQNLMNQSI